MTSRRHDPFGRSALPAGFSREDRVRLLREVADALLADRPPDRAAALFVGSAFDAWLTRGGGLGALERDYLGVTPPRGSHRTAAAIHRDERAAAAAERRLRQDDMDPEDFAT